MSSCNVNESCPGGGGGAQPFGVFIAVFVVFKLQMADDDFRGEERNELEGQLQFVSGLFENVGIKRTGGQVKKGRVQGTRKLVLLEKGGNAGKFCPVFLVEAGPLKADLRLQTMF